MLIRDVEKFMRAHDISATKFGRLAASDPRFVLDLRMGRIPRPATEARIRAWMKDYAAALTLETKSAADHDTAVTIIWREFDHAA